jgi:hypothetical protein
MAEPASRPARWRTHLVVLAALVAVGGIVTWNDYAHPYVAGGLGDVGVELTGALTAIYWSWLGIYAALSTVLFPRLRRTRSSFIFSCVALPVFAAFLVAFLGPAVLDIQQRRESERQASFSAGLERFGLQAAARCGSLASWRIDADATPAQVHMVIDPNSDGEVWAGVSGDLAGVGNVQLVDDAQRMTKHPMRVHEPVVLDFYVRSTATPSQIAFNIWFCCGGQGPTVCNRYESGRKIEEYEQSPGFALRPLPHPQ